MAVPAGAQEVSWWLSAVPDYSQVPVPEVSGMMAATPLAAVQAVRAAAAAERAAWAETV
jgi:hypothetical protein